MHSTGNSLSEALIFASTNPQYDDRLFIVHKNCKLRIPAEHVVYTNCFFLHSEQFGYTTCSADVASSWKRFTCHIFNEPDIETLIKLKVRESLVVLHLAAELSLNPVCKLSSTAPKASSSSLETEWVYWV